jgi:hypothetical protein
LLAKKNGPGFLRGRFCFIATGQITGFPHQVAEGLFVNPQRADQERDLCAAIHRAIVFA